MQMTEKKISILMPSFHYKQYIKKVISTASEQTHKNFEL